MQLFSEAEVRTLSSILAVVLLLSSVPLTGGMVIVSRPSQPEITINICQPVQAFDCVSKTLLARPTVSLPQFVLCFLDWLAAAPSPQVADRTEAPDPPPPKRFV
jgi:hypothetical protein